MKLIRISPIIGIATIIAASSIAIARPAHPTPIIRPAPAPIARVVVAPHPIFHHVAPLMRVGKTPTTPRTSLAPRPLPFPPPQHHPTPVHPKPTPGPIVRPPS